LGFPGTVKLVPDFQNTAEINTYPGHVSQTGTFMYVPCCVQCILTAALAWFVGA